MNRIEPLNTTDTKAQRELILSRLKQGQCSTQELRDLGVYYPPSRVKELRNQGYQIDTIYQKKADHTGLVHKLGFYVLRQTKDE